MKIRYLRWIDKHIGIIICLILSIFDWLFRHLRHNDGFDLRKNSRPSKILIIKFWGFGSIILASAAFQAIRRSFPHAYICVLTLRQNEPVYEMLGMFDAIVGIEIDSLPRFLCRMKKVILGLRNTSFDIALDLEFTSRFSAIVTYLSNARKRIGFAYRGVWRGNCFTENVEFREDVKLKESFLNLIKTIIDVNSYSPLPAPILIKEDECASIDNLLRQEGIIDKSPLVGMNINASELCLLRRWPKEYFVDLAKRLIERYSAHIIFIGDKQDTAYVQETIKEMPFKDYIHNFAGKTTLAGLSYLLGKLNLFITNDSGPLHLAVHIGIPTVSFFGPETPVIYGQEGQIHTVFYNHLRCSPCIRIKNYKHYRCQYNHECLRKITPDEVFKEVQRKRIL